MIKGFRLNTLLIYAHPVPSSFNAAVFEVTKQALLDAGHDLRVTDLYAEEFDPVLTREDREAYLTDTQSLIDKVPEHVANLRWAEALVFVFPTWYYGPPAILKGWFERVWLSGVTFEVAERKGQTTSSKIRNIRRLLVITTSGSPAWWMFLIGNPCKRLFMRALRVLFHPRCKSTWMQLYDMNVIDQTERAKFLEKVKRKATKL